VNLTTFAHIPSNTNDPHLILLAPSKVDRREFLLAVKKSSRALKALLHLNPQSRAIKSLIYYKAKRNHLHIDDRGDILIVYQPHNTHQNVKIDITTSTPEITTILDTFLGEMTKTRLPRTHTHNTQRH
jgi:hypothetical protein